MRSLLMVMAFPMAATAAPVQLAHQARLLDVDGTPINGPTALGISLWDADSGGQSIWSGEWSAITIDDGFVSVMLGQDNLLDSADLLATDVWLGITVAGQTLPRQRLVSVVHAATASAVQLGAVETCDADHAGIVRFSDGVFAGCNGTAWVQFGIEMGDELRPGATCADIRSVRPTAADGVFWVNAGTTDTANPVFCDMNGGWTMIAKASQGSAAGMGQTFLGGGTNNLDESVLHRAVSPVKYVSRFAAPWWTAADFTEVRLELWDDGVLVRQILFDATGQSNSTWFTLPRVRSVVGWTDLAPGQSVNAFTIEEVNSRDFYISKLHNSCPNDRGWLAITEGVSCTDWHNPSVDQILYSGAATNIDWTNGTALSASARYADTMVVFAR